MIIESVTSIVDYSKPLVFDDLTSNVLEGPQAIKGVQSALMVMSSSHGLGASPKHGQDGILSFKNSHHAIVKFENQSISPSSNPSLIFHDPIT